MKGAKKGSEDEQMRTKNPWALAFAYQYDDFPQGDELLNVEPLVDRPVLHRGEHWSMTALREESVSAEVAARMLNTKLPKELEGVNLRSLFELANIAPIKYF